MNRLIPGKTKVRVELFRGVTIGDVAVGAVGLGMIVLVLISSLPWKMPICIGVVLLAGTLLLRIDETANYEYIMQIITHFAYDRRFARLYSDQMLKDRAAGNGDEAAFRAISEQIRQTVAEAKKPKETGKERKEKERERKAEEKARVLARKDEDRILKSKRSTAEEKAAIREKRAAEAAAAMRRSAVAREERTRRKSMDRIIPFTDIREGCIEYGKDYYGGVIEIDPVEFRFFSESRRRNSIEACLGRVLRSLHGKYSANIVKLERPINYDAYLDRERRKVRELTGSFESGLLTEEEYKVRVEIEYDRINELRDLSEQERVLDEFFYLVLFESDRRQLDMMLRDALEALRQGELTARRLDNKGLALFLKYSNQMDFDEHDVDAVRGEDLAAWAMPDVVDIKYRHVEINHIIAHHFRVVNYPTVVGDAWLARVMSLPGTKVVLKCRQMDRDKAIRGIDRSLMELRGQWSATGVDSRRLEIEEHLSTLQELLTTLPGENEVLLECNIYITAYDIAATRADLRLYQPPDSLLTVMSDMKKTVRRTWSEAGFRLNHMEFDQTAAFIGPQISGLDPHSKRGRGIPSNTVAACYPWIYAHVSDEGGIRLGESGGIPVFIDFFRRDSERVNSNMVIVGKSGSGKSYATKSLLVNLAAEDAKIFILDPENEYTELAANLHGKFINVGNAQYGRLNPFHIITALEDDEGGESGGSYATHLQFLEEFFKQILPDIDKDALEYLNNMTDRVYFNRGITPTSDLSRLRAEDYPTFDDLYEAIVAEFQRTDNQYLRTTLRTLMNYVAKFSEGGRNANIWNGPSTVTTDENFTVFNFQSMLANRNGTIANAQMLLVLKYIDNEIIKNRDYNTKYGLNRKIVVVIDEAHVFIDNKFPIALDFMFQLAKRIRKYNGMQIVITQNIKDFVGSEEIARKSTAIINACQYSFIFALAPNDMQDLVKLYSNAGGINESEQEQIVQAPRGQAFTVMSPTSRSSFRVETPEELTRLFERRNVESEYFSGEDGEAVWEDFVAGSRALRIEPERANEEAEKSETAASGGGLLLEEVSLEEYQNELRQEEEASDALIIEEEIFDPGEQEALRAYAEQKRPTLPPDAPATGSNAPVDRLINALSGFMERFGPQSTESETENTKSAAVLTAEETPPSVGTSPELQRMREEMAALREQNERLRRQNGQLQDKLLSQFEEFEEKETAPATPPVAEEAPLFAPAAPLVVEEAPLFAPATPTAAEEAPLFAPPFSVTESAPAEEQPLFSMGADALFGGGGSLFGPPPEGGSLFGGETEESSVLSDIVLESIGIMSRITPLDRLYNGGESVMEITLEDLEVQIESEREYAAKK